MCMHTHHNEKISQARKWETYHLKCDISSGLKPSSSLWCLTLSIPVYTWLDFWRKSIKRSFTTPYPLSSGGSTFVSSQFWVYLRESSEMNRTIFEDGSWNLYLILIFKILLSFFSNIIFQSNCFVLFWPFQIKCLRKEGFSDFHFLYFR